MTENFVSITLKIQNYLGFVSSLGVKGADCSEQAMETLKSWGRRALPQEKTLFDIEEELSKCRKCRLAESGNQAIMGAGRPGVRLMFIGGWPEAEDGVSGRPYSGKAGELLTRIIKAMNLSNDEVYISYALKCRPDETVQPAAADVRICCRYVLQEIDIVKPDIICTLGELAALALLGTQVPWGELRGRFQYYKETPVMPTFSPEYLLDNPSAKRETWDDIKQILSALSKMSLT